MRVPTLLAVLAVAVTGAMSPAVSWPAGRQPGATGGRSPVCGRPVLVHRHREEWRSRSKVHLSVVPGEKESPEPAAEGEAPWSSSSSWSCSPSPLPRWQL